MAHLARYRTRTGLLPLVAGLQVSSESGRHDKIEVTLRGETALPTGVPLGWIQTSLAREGSVLRAANGRGATKLRQAVRREWLFGGELTYEPGNVNAGRMAVRARLKLNPTTFAAHLERFELATLAEVLRLPARELLSKNPAWTRTLQRRSTNREDNYIPAGPWLSEINRNWRALVRGYLDAVRQLLEEEFAGVRIPGAPQRFELNLQPFSEAPDALGRVEVHWEVGCDSARAAMGPLIRSAFASAPRISATTAPEAGHIGGMAWVSCQLRTGVKLSIYAKLPDRIRFEVSYTPARGRSLGSMLGSRTGFTSGMSLDDRLRRIAQDASARLNPALAVLLDAPTVERLSKAAAFCDLVAKLAEIAGRRPRHRRREVVEVILSPGAVVASFDSPAFGTIQNLVAEGIFERVRLTDAGRPAVFRPTQRYLPLVDALRALIAEGDDAPAE